MRKLLLRRLEFVPAVVEADPPAVASKAQTIAGTIEVEDG
jgi:hypothetical protein